MSMVNVSIVGATGYTGVELIRWILQHPLARLHRLYSLNHVGEPFSMVWPAFSGIVDQKLEHIQDVPVDDASVLFLCLPHGESASLVSNIIKTGNKLAIIDLGSDFRFQSIGEYEKYYRFEHPAPDLLSRFAYGLPEYFRNQIIDSRYVANPGCFATAIQLAVLPLIQQEFQGDIHITGLTGSSGSGNKPGKSTHFSTRNENVIPYKVLEHQHLGEVYQSIRKMSAVEPLLAFTPVSGPFVRGIWVSVSIRNHMGLQADEVYSAAYYNAPFIRLVEGMPDLKQVVGSNFADIGWATDGHSLVVNVVIDNLVKGASGQAIQNMNLMFDLPETTGLLYPGYLL